MKRRIVVFAMLIVTTLFWMPASGNAVAAQQGQNKNHGNGRGNNDRGDRGDWQQWRHAGKWMHGRKDTHGYRNYGQFRRTQVGNRRYRMTRRYYWQNGSRLSRWTRIYY